MWSGLIAGVARMFPRAIRLLISCEGRIPVVGEPFVGRSALLESDLTLFVGHLKDLKDAGGYNRL